MPKPMTCTIHVPSKSRASSILSWLDNLLQPHNMRCTMVTDNDALDQATPQNDNTATVEDVFKAGFSAAWGMGGYGDYDPNEQSAWEEFKKEKGL